MKARLLAVLLLALAALPNAAGAARRRRAPTDAHQLGLQLYSRGKLSEALAVYEGILRRVPEDEVAQLAVRRLRADLVERARPVPVEDDEKPVLDQLSAAFDSFFLEQLAGVLNFEDSLGDRLEGLGELEAGEGKVRQLMAERRAALARGGGYARDRELRASLRRLPAVG